MRVTWRWQPGEHESLAVCLRAVLAGVGQERPYPELLATLGLGLAVTATGQERPQAWPTYARDLNLPQTGELYGLHIRPLHPPGAAAWLGTSREFPAHFRDSYVPLIVRALEHGQAVLAWRGWPPPADRLWGLIGSWDSEHLSGCCPGHPEPVRLAGAAHQVYIVEEWRPEEAHWDEPRLFQTAVRHALRFWRSPPAPADYELGLAAWRSWTAAAERDAQACSAALTVLAASRQALADWLESILDRLDAGLHLPARDWAQAARQVAGLLISQETPTPASLRAAVVQAGQIEADLVRTLRSRGIDG